MATDDLPGLPEPPDVGTSALPPGTFDGSVVMVTGGGTGLGKAIAGEFARLGASLVIASRKPEHLDAAVESIEAIGAPVTTAACDIRDADAVSAAFDAAESAFGLPQVLVNNAAANFPVPAEDMSPNAWRTSRMHTARAASLTKGASHTAAKRSSLLTNRPACVTR